MTRSVEGRRSSAPAAALGKANGEAEHWTCDMAREEVASFGQH
jgi:hypothetical protein